MDGMGIAVTIKINNSCRFSYTSSMDPLGLVIDKKKHGVFFINHPMFGSDGWTGNCLPLKRSLCLRSFWGNNPIDDEMLELWTLRIHTFMNPRSGYTQGYSGANWFPRIYLNCGVKNQISKMAAFNGLKISYSTHDLGSLGGECRNIHHTLSVCMDVSTLRMFWGWQE